MPAAKMTPSPFGTDQVLLYNVAPWGELGFGVANFGRHTTTLSQPLQSLSDEMGQHQLFIMTHMDATRRRPPSRNTIERLCRMLNRVFSVLTMRMKSYSEIRTEEVHGSPAPLPWMLHPVPYFVGPIVRNQWLKQYNALCMLALTNIYQHSDNNLALTITDELARDILVYFNDMRLLIGGELLQIPKADLLKPDFLFTEAHYAAYRPDQVTIRLEGLDNSGDINYRFTEEDLQPLMNGIPASLIIPNLAKYPTAAVDSGFYGARGEPAEADGAIPGAFTAITPVL